MVNQTEELLALVTGLQLDRVGMEQRIGGFPAHPSVDGGVSSYRKKCDRINEIVLIRFGREQQRDTVLLDQDLIYAVSLAFSDVIVQRVFRFMRLLDGIEAGLHLGSQVFRLRDLGKIIVCSLKCVCNLHRVQMIDPKALHDKTTVRQKALQCDHRNQLEGFITSARPDMPVEGQFSPRFFTGIR